MRKPSVLSSAPHVHLVDEMDLGVRVTRRGSRSQDGRCRLTIIANDAEAASFVEEAGSDAPPSAVIELMLPPDAAGALLDALKTRPWRHSDIPVITYARSRDGAGGGCDRSGAVDYLIKNRAVGDVIQTIRETLDLSADVI